MRFFLEIKHNGELLNTLIANDRKEMTHLMVVTSLPVLSSHPRRTDVLPFSPDAMEIRFTLDDRDGDVFEFHLRPEHVTTEEDVTNLIMALTEMLLSDDSVTNIISIMTDIFTGGRPRTESMGMFTTGEVRMIQGWWGCRWIVEEMFSMWIGRAVRTGLMDAFGWSEKMLIDRATQHIASSIDLMYQKRAPIIDEIIKQARVRFGNASVDVAASKRLRNAIDDEMEKITGVRLQHDNKYD